MQRSSTRFLGCLWQRPRVLFAFSQAQVRCISGQDPDDTPGLPLTPASDSTNRDTSASLKTATKATAKEAIGMPKTEGQQTSKPAGGMSTRFTMREDSMWRDPKTLDTKWLRSRDSNGYKPDFKQTEPQSLRNQFMRSPDERTRDAMGRDWEMAVRLASNRRRQALLAKERRDKEMLAKDVERGIGRHYRKTTPKPKQSTKKQKTTDKKSPPKKD